MDEIIRFRPVCHTRSSMNFVNFFINITTTYVIVINRMVKIKLQTLSNNFRSTADRPIRFYCMIIGLEGNHSSTTFVDPAILVVYRKDFYK